MVPLKFMLWVRGVKGCWRVLQRKGEHSPGYGGGEEEDNTNAEFSVLPYGVRYGGRPIVGQEVVWLLEPQ